MTKEGEPTAGSEITHQFLREGAAHLATQFGTGVDLFKDLMAAANALQDGDPQKAERILRIKFVK